VQGHPTLPPVIDLPNGSKLLLRPPNSTISKGLKGTLKFPAAAIHALGYTANSSAKDPPNMNVQLWLHGPDAPAVPPHLAGDVEQLQPPPAEQAAAVVEALGLRADTGSVLEEAGNLLVLQVRAKAKLYKYVQQCRSYECVLLSKIKLLEHLTGCRYLGVEKVSKTVLAHILWYGMCCLEIRAYLEARCFTIQIRGHE
jgi:hypothetical protein